MQHRNPGISRTRFTSKSSRMGEVILSKQNNIRDASEVCNSRVYPRATGNAAFAKHQHSGQRKVGDGGINSSERPVCHTAGL